MQSKYILIITGVSIMIFAGCLALQVPEHLESSFEIYCDYKLKISKNSSYIYSADLPIVFKIFTGLCELMVISTIELAGLIMFFVGIKKI